MQDSLGYIPIIIEGLKTRVAQPRNISLHPPKLGVLAKCLSEHSEYSILQLAIATCSTDCMYMYSYTVELPIVDPPRYRDTI